MALASSGAFEFRVVEDAVEFPEPYPLQETVLFVAAPGVLAADRQLEGLFQRTDRIWSGSLRLWLEVLWLLG